MRAVEGMVLVNHEPENRRSYRIEILSVTPKTYVWKMTTIADNGVEVPFFPRRTKAESIDDLLRYGYQITNWGS